MQSYPQREMRPMQPAALSPVTVNVPLPPPKKIPSFLAASEVYRDFQDVNSKSHLEDDILANPRKFNFVPLLKKHANALFYSVLAFLIGVYVRNNHECSQQLKKKTVSCLKIRQLVLKHDFWTHFPSNDTLGQNRENPFI